jgi:hypothetical protein
MLRRVSMLALAVATFAAAGGCRSRCGSGWFTSRADTPCHLAGGGCPEAPALPVGGAFPQGAPGAVLPGTGSPYELPQPQPSDLIPRPGVPFAPPSPAPPDGGASLLPAPKGGVPVGR